MPLIFDNSAFDRGMSNSRRTSFSGADIRAIIHRPGFEVGDSDDDMYPNSEGLFHELGSIRTLTISSHRSKAEVRSLGHQNVMGYARGSRTIAGTLIFALLDTHPFNDDSTGWGDVSNGGILRRSSGSLNIEDQGFIEDNLSTGSIASYDATISRKHEYDFTWDSQLWGQLMHPDELPPFNIIISFANEAGSIGKMALLGVELLGQSKTLSIEDLYTEVVYQYTARAMQEFEEGTFNGRLWSGGPGSAYAADYALQQLIMDS